MSDIESMPSMIARKILNPPMKLSKNNAGK